MNKDPGASSLIWEGLEIPADIPPFSLSDALTHSARFAMLAAQMGYRGYLNIDAIITDSGELMFNEVNARWGGGLALHVIGERLLGPRYADDHVVSSLRNARPAPLPEVLRLLQERRLHFDGDSREGVLVVAYDPTLADPMECLIVGSSRHRLREIEDTLLDALNGLAPAKMPAEAMN
jgi:hypothetical protein